MELIFLAMPAFQLMRSQTLVVHKNRDKNKMLHMKTNGLKRED